MLLQARVRNWKELKGPGSSFRYSKKALDIQFFSNVTAVANIHSSGHERGEVGDLEIQAKGVLGEVLLLLGGEEVAESEW